MDWINVGVTVLLLVSAAIFMVIRFLKQPSSKQIDQIKQWLLNAVVQAEAEFGTGTGALKLSAVYDMFVEKFPWIAKIVGIDFFNGLVDDVLETMRELLSSNTAVEAYVNLEETESE